MKIYTHRRAELEHIGRLFFDVHDIEQYLDVVFLALGRIKIDSPIIITRVGVSA